MYPSTSTLLHTADSSSRPIYNTFQILAVVIDGSEVSGTQSVSCRSIPGVLLLAIKWRLPYARNHFSFSTSCYVSIAFMGMCDEELMCLELKLTCQQTFGNGLIVVSPILKYPINGICRRMILPRHTADNESAARNTSQVSRCPMWHGKSDAKQLQSWHDYVASQEDI